MISRLCDTWLLALPPPITTEGRTHNGGTGKTVFIIHSGLANRGSIPKISDSSSDIRCKRQILSTLKDFWNKYYLFCSGKYLENLMNTFGGNADFFLLRILVGVLPLRKQIHSQPTYFRLVTSAAPVTDSSKFNRSQ